MVASDHVAVQHRHDLPKRHHRMGGVVTGAQQAAFLGAVVDEEQGTLRTSGHEGSGGGELGDTHGSVVVGPRQHGVARYQEPDTIGILVGTVEDVFVPKFRVGAADGTDHVHGGCLEPFEPNE